MDRPKRSRILKIGGILIVASIVLFAVSVYLIESNTTSASSISIAPGNTYTLTGGFVNSGDDIDYTVTSNFSTFNITAFVSITSGTIFGNETAVKKSSLTGVYVSPGSGNISLTIRNTGTQTINIDASIGTIGYSTLLTVIFGFVLLPSGIVLVGVYYYSRHAERRKEKRLREYP